MWLGPFGREELESGFEFLDGILVWCYGSTQTCTLWRGIESEAVHVREEVLHTPEEEEAGPRVVRVHVTPHL